MKKVKKIMSALLTGALTVNVLAGCGSSGSSTGTTTAAETTTAAPQETTAEIEAGASSVSDDVTATEEQVENVVIVLPQASFDLAPFSSGRITSMVWYTLYSSLMCSPYLGAPLDELENRMAKTVTKVSDTEYDVELFDYIKDSQGNDITAEDVVYSFEYASSIGAYPCLGSYLESISAIDDYNVKIVLKAPTIGAIEQLLDQVTVVDKGWHENASAEERSQNPATTGTYTVESVVSGSNFVLLAKDDYWQKDEQYISKIDHQTAKRLTYTAITEMAMVSVALENNEVDMAEIDGTISSNFVDENGNAKEGYNFFTYEVPRFNVLEYNCSPDSPFNDIYLRQACSYALDSNAIMEAAGVALGMGTVCHDYGNAAGGGYNTEWDSEDYYDYNLEKAKELMAQSQYADGVDVYLLFAISTAPNVAIVIQAQLAEIGVNVVIDSVEQALYDTMVLDSTQWDMATRLPSMSDFLTSGWASRFDENVFPESRTGNFVDDDKLQELLKEACDTQDPEAIEAFHDYLKEQCYAIGLYTANKCFITQEGVLSNGGTYAGNSIFNGVAYSTDYVSAANQ